MTWVRWTEDHKPNESRAATEFRQHGYRFEARIWLHWARHTVPESCMCYGTPPGVMMGLELLHNDKLNGDDDDTTTKRDTPGEG